MLYAHSIFSPPFSLALPTLPGMSTTIDPTASHISGYNMGTPCYAAPEVMMNHQCSKTSDVSGTARRAARFPPGAAPFPPLML